MELEDNCQRCSNKNAIELQWLEHLWDYKTVFETGVVRANECKA